MESNTILAMAVPGILSTIAALGGAYLGYLSTHEAELTKQNLANIENSKGALARLKFEEEQSIRDEDNLKQIISKLTNENPEIVKEGTVMLMVLFPEKKTDVLNAVELSVDKKILPLPPSPPPFTVEATKPVKPTKVAKPVPPEVVPPEAKLVPTEVLAQIIPTKSIYSWAIVSGGDPSLSAAQDEIKRAKTAGFSAQIYLKKGRYRTVIGYYADKIEANRMNFAVRTSIRPDAYVVNLEDWCPKKNTKEESDIKYFVCELDGTVE